MSTGKIIFYVILVILGITALSLVTRSCSTANKMADQTVFNADKNVWNYEQFHQQYESYQQFKKQKHDADSAVNDLEAKDQTKTQRYDNLVMEAGGASNMMHRIAADYNKMSNVAYQKVWKSKGLPESLSGYD